MKLERYRVRTSTETFYVVAKNYNDARAKARAAVLPGQRVLSVVRSETVS